MPSEHVRYVPLHLLSLPFYFICKTKIKKSINYNIKSSKIEILTQLAYRDNGNKLW